MIYVKVNGTLYPASVAGRMSDAEWDGRESKLITMTADFATADSLFQDGAAWSIVSEDPVPVYNEQGNPVIGDDGEPVYETQQTEFDNSEYSIRGDLTVHVDGYLYGKDGQAYGPGRRI